MLINGMKIQTIVVMGVSGSGKTTIGSLLAQALGWEFFDADEFHPLANKKKMSNGIPLTDEDRAGWLEVLRGLILQQGENKLPCVLACSALKQRYREALAVNEKVRFVYLHGSYEQVETRLKRRMGHYMTVQLLQSQFEALEEPREAIIIDISHTPEEIVDIIRKGLDL